VFTPLGRDDVREIARRLLADIGKALFAQRGVRLDVEPAAIDFLLDAGGFDPTLGARPMKRTLARYVEAPLAEKILQGSLDAGDVALITLDGDELGIDVVAGSASSAAE
jgi:ATP-dependent Clp protease ATP-binding subunit ClpC